MSERESSPEVSFGELLNAVNVLRSEKCNQDEAKNLLTMIREGVEKGTATWKSLHTTDDEIGNIYWNACIRADEQKWDQRFKENIEEIKRNEESWGVAKIKRFTQDMSDRVKSGSTTWEQLGTTEEELKTLANQKIKHRDK